MPGFSLPTSWDYLNYCDNRRVCRFDTNGPQYIWVEHTVRARRGILRFDLEPEMRASPALLRRLRAPGYLTPDPSPL
jgi:hypothetical protein